MEEFVLITLDEYTCLLSSNFPVQNEQPPLKSKSTRLDVTIQDILNACGAVQNGNTSQFDEGKLCSQLNMNSRLAQTHKRKDATLDDTIADRAKTIAKMDKIVMGLSSLGLSGGKLERAPQILQKIDQCNIVTIDRDSSRLLLHERGLGITVFDFLINLETTTKNLCKTTLDLVKRLKLPTFLLANTNAKRVSEEVARYDSNEIEEVGSCATAKWLRLYQAANSFSIISRKKFLSKQLFFKLWDKERTVGNQNLYEQ